MDKKYYRLQRAICIVIFATSSLLFLKTKNTHVMVFIYFSTAMFAKIAELILWINESDK